MVDSKITHFGNGGVMLAGPDAVRVFAAATLRSALGLMSKGITPTRGFTLKRGLAMAQEYTGRTYKRTEVEQCRKDLLVWIETMKSGIPTEIKP